MSEQKRDFFYWVKYVYKAYKGITKYYDLENRPVVYSEECHQTLNRFIDYIERCEFSNKKVDKFLCKNWKFTKDQLVDLWMQEFGKVKNVNTFRSQRSTLSLELYAIFGDEWAGDFMDNNCSDLRERLDMLEKKAVNFNSLTLAETGINTVYKAQNSYTLDDLTTELAFLHKYNREAYNREFSKINSDKLAFIKDKLNEPLCMDGRFNMIKAELLRRIEGIDYSNLRFPIEEVAGSKQLKTIMHVMDDNAITDSNADRVSELKEFFYQAFSLEGLYEYLSQFSPEDIKKAYNELNELVR